MKARNGKMKPYVMLLSGGLVLAPLTAIAGEPVGATLQTEGNAGYALAGNELPAKLSVVVTKPDSNPATGFAPNRNNVLPAGWSLTSGFNEPPDGCGMVPMAFTNVGAGIYTIDVLPDCPWVAGEHHYMVSVGEGNRGNLRASTLGTLTLEVPIPEVPIPQ